MTDLNTLIDKAEREASKRNYDEAASLLKQAIDVAPLSFLPQIEATRDKYQALHKRGQVKGWKRLLMLPGSDRRGSDERA